MSAPQLRVTEIRTKDVLGLREWVMTPGRINIITGSNSSGKTSTLTAIRAALQGGNLTNLVHVDADGEQRKDADGKPIPPEVVLVLDGPGEHYRVERSGKKLSIRQRVADTAALEKLPAPPQEWLDSLIDRDATNPMALIGAKDDATLAQLLLQALPLKLDRAALAAILAPIPAKVVRPVAKGLHPLEELDAISGDIFAARTGVNRDHDGKAKSADQLRRSVPAELPADPAAAVAAALADVERLAGEVTRAEEAAEGRERDALATSAAVLAEIESRVKADFAATKTKALGDHERWAATERAQLEQRIATQRAEVDAAVEEARTAGEADLDAADAAHVQAGAAAAAARLDALAAISPKREETARARERMAVLGERSKLAAEHANTLAMARRFEAEAAELGATSDTFTRALDSLKDLRQEMAKDLPIPGLSITAERGVRVNGVPISQVNTAARIDIAVRVCALRAKTQRLPCIFVDGAEALDHDNFEALCARLEKEPVLVFISRVTDTPFAVETRGELARA